MRIAMVGLGRMGANMRTRLRAREIDVVGYDRDPSVRDVDSLESMVDRLGPGPRIVWIMLPAGVVDDTLARLSPLLRGGDVVVDGGNSRWTDDAPRAGRLAARDIGYADCGVSGGVWGAEGGYGLMVGGAQADVSAIWPVLEALVPEDGSGLVHAGDVGAGHYAKMVHNGIEYALMEAYAEGYELLAAGSPVNNITEVFDAWRSGTVIRSWLLDLCTEALRADPGLARITGWVDDSGEGRWTVEAALDAAVPVPAISASLFARYASRQEDSPAMKLVAAMRHEFGGHPVHDAG
ncbi:phosphogluconate dehydrogenase (NAD(+)-dependent, decarboxylating) [Acidipropionibacterium virtanenii]|uniref:6-phosphogluconate dehydrogenase, NAD(+)-dependent, decarboxylating n=1 Tax=Acidipropionibacterium virtanenii TaxID=2057246 RepID=A0A344UVB5_9ACTN|nr:decarboxylating 6-phosphogluconate dehydrogenase [Acidipropionibacterium virtanenii]AXE39213.1 6-phosphogluconate dehydrogenase, NAD(+)-dependent, decarboxylating [Acidipropionibacterium virtanenii]